MRQGSVDAVTTTVIDVVFDDIPPAIGEVVIIEPLDAKLVVEAIQEDGTVQCLNIENNTSIERGMKVTSTGAGIQIQLSGA